MFMRKTIAWYRSHDPMTQVKLKSVLDQDISEFQNVSLSVLVITLKELGSMYDLSGSDFGDQVIKELVRLASCFFNEDYIYRDGYNSFIILDHSDQFSDRLTRFKDNVSHYEINHYRVYTTLQFGFVQAYLTAPAMIYELIAKARRSQDHAQPLQCPIVIQPVAGFGDAAGHQQPNSVVVVKCAGAYPRKLTDLINGIHGFPSCLNPV